MGPGMSTASTPTVAPTKRGSRASSMIASAAAFMQSVAVALVGAQHRPEFLGHRDGDVEVGRRQHLELARLDQRSVWSVWHLGQLRFLHEW